MPAAGAAAPVAWRQTGGEVTLEAACPKELSRKDVVCLFTTHSVHLEAAGRIIADGQLFAPITPDECCWEFGARPAVPPCTHESRQVGLWGNWSTRLWRALHSHCYGRAALPKMRLSWCCCCWCAGHDAKTGGGSVSKRLIVDLVKAPLPQSRCLWKTLYAAGDEARAVYVH